MNKYLVAIHHPTTTTPLSQRTKRWTAILTHSTIDEGCWYQGFRSRLTPGDNAKSLRRQPDGNLLITGGPYL